MAAVLTPLVGNVLASARTNVRAGAPNTTAPIRRTLAPGDAFAVSGLTQGEAVAGQGDWYVGAAGDDYVWAGATRLAGAAFQSAMGLRREDGTLRPLPQDEIERRFGTFAYVEAAGGRIIPDPAWTRANLVDLPTPTLNPIGVDRVTVHRLAGPYFQKALETIEAAGMTGFIVAVDGAYVPRHMTWNVQRPLSRHSWGVAMDLNARWNGYGVQPAPMGAHGSVREIVPYFEAQGFAWGGRFQPISGCDGMHFELARIDVGGV